MSLCISLSSRSCIMLSSFVHVLRSTYIVPKLVHPQSVEQYCDGLGIRDSWSTTVAVLGYISMNGHGMQYTMAQLISFFWMIICSSFS